MLVSAILVVGHDSPTHSQELDSPETGTLAGAPLACLEVLGASVVERTAQTLRHAGVPVVTVVMADEFSHHLGTMDGAEIRPVPAPTDLWSAAECVLREHIHHGVGSILLARLGCYAEFDLPDLIRFHRDSKAGITTLDKDGGTLEAWLIEAREVHNMSRIGLPRLLASEKEVRVANYPLQGYVSKLETAADLRRLAKDSLDGRSSITPRGQQVQSGIWLDEDVQIRRNARVVAPAYVGRGVILRGGALVAGSSVVERGCDIGEATMIIDASILAETRVGRGLNVAHAVVDGGHLVPLKHHVTLDIHDARLLGRTVNKGTRQAGGTVDTSLAERLLATAWN